MLIAKKVSKQKQTKKTNKTSEQKKQASKSSNKSKQQKQATKASKQSKQNVDFGGHYVPVHTLHSTQTFGANLRAKLCFAFTK